MKSILAVFMMFLAISGSAQAWIAMPDQTKNFTFKFNKFNGEVYEYAISSGNQEDAFRKAADACFNHFKQGRHVSMDYGQDIIDICVNPKTI